MSGQKRWIPFGAFLAFVASVILAANGGTARWLFAWIERYPGSDKAGHFLLIGTLAWTLNYGLRGRLVSLGIARVQMGGMMIAVLMTVEECSQLWISTRRFDLSDLAANYAGILVAGWLSQRRTVE